MLAAPRHRCTSRLLSHPPSQVTDELHMLRRVHSFLHLTILGKEQGQHEGPFSGSVLAGRNTIRLQTQNNTAPALAVKDV